MGSSQLNIAIAGAGVMGLCAAHVLRKNNYTTIYDPAGFPAANASAMAGGMLAPYAEIEHLPAEFTEAALAGINFWEKIPGAQFKKSGTLLIAHAEDTYMLERFAQKLPGTAKTNIAALEPQLEKFGSGIFLPEEAHINPTSALDALTDERERMLTQPCYIEKAKDAFDWVVDCRGIAAEDPGIRGVKGEIITVRNPEFSLSRPVRLMHPRYPLYIIPRGNHAFVIGATVIESAGETVALKSAMELLSAAYSLHSSFGEAEIVGISAGVRPAYSDNLPRITVEGNIIRCNGLFRHGYLLAPVMAACVADYIAGTDNEFSHLFMRTHDHHQRAEKKRKRA
jgi:glycine oxidase